MHRLLPMQYPAALALYREHGAYFPLIGAVLSDSQDGVVYADSSISPRQVYVEHAFGFAQVFGASTPTFEASLRHYLLIDRAFSSAKVRLYTPFFPSFLDIPEYDQLRSWRQHFRLSDVDLLMEFDEKPPDTSLVNVDIECVGAVEASFGVVSRFWRTPKDFVDKSNAILALVSGTPAALCYAAAVEDGLAEIDVLTLPHWRNRGLAAATVRVFNKRCLSQDVLPLWDCFTNNAASMALCRSAGFSPLGAAYPFFTINRQPLESI